MLKKINDNNNKKVLTVSLFEDPWMFSSQPNWPLLLCLQDKENRVKMLPSALKNPLFQHLIGEREFNT